MNPQTLPLKNAVQSAFPCSKPDADVRCHPPVCGCRGYIGLAALFDDPDAGECVSEDHVFYCTDKITWLCLRDVPGGYWLRQAQRRSGRVTCATTTQGKLHYGMPRLDFRNSDEGNILERAEESCSREHSVVARLKAAIRGTVFQKPVSSQMTGQSRQGTDCPRRRLPQPPRCWMPKAYLAYKREAVITTQRHLRIGILPMALHRPFQQALYQRLPLHVSCDSVYLGMQPGPSEFIACYHFKEVATGRLYHLDLPLFVNVCVRQGQIVKAGERWCQAMPDYRITRSLVVHPSQAMREMCGGTITGNLLLQAWWLDQGIVLPSQGDLVLFPAESVAHLATLVRPSRLFWDMAPAEHYTVGAVDAAIFPPIWLGSAKGDRFTLPGEVEIICGLGRADAVRFERPPHIAPISTAFALARAG